MQYPHTTNAFDRTDRSIIKRQGVFFSSSPSILRCTYHEIFVFRRHRKRLDFVVACSQFVLEGLDPQL